IVHQLIKQLFINSYYNHKVYQQDLANSLFISETSLKTELKEAKNKLESINVYIKSSNLNGMSLEANEESLRLGIKTYLFAESEHSQQSQKLYASLGFVGLKSEDRISDEINKAFSKKNIKLTCDAITRLRSLIIIATSRFKYNFNVTYSYQ